MAVEDIEQLIATDPANPRYNAEGQLKSTIGYNQKDELRAHAAVMAVDMEEGKVERKKGVPWTGSYSRTEIAKRMGYSPKRLQKLLPVFLRDPEFSNWVQYERIKRKAHANMSLEEVKPLAQVGATALLMEMVRRALLHPDAIKDKELFTETRQWFTLLKDMEGKGGKVTDTLTIVNNFRLSIRGLPKEAQERALAYFDGSIKQLTSGARDEP